MHFQLIKRLDTLQISDKFQFLYIIIIWKTLIGQKSFSIEDVINRMKVSVANKIKIAQSFINPKENLILKLDLVDIDMSEFINDSIVSLSNKSIRMLETEDIKISFDLKNNRPKDVIMPDEISKTKLFFDEKEKRQLDSLQAVLMPNKYKALRKRLTDNNLSTGLTAIFFGHPGTGKTESVLQLAKKSGRKVMKVDISQSKSKWLGESEKLIKKIFTDYYKFKSQEKKVPILLVNEADAIISKRKDVGFSNVTQTENTMENIILEELENFTGILMATTNLVENIDSAFERRFLFKVEFSKPTVGVKSKIWKNKIKSLSVKNSKKLASKYDFTGGQINNIIRKIEIFKVINNLNIDFDRIEEFCQEENFNNISPLRIGFGKHAS